MSFGDVHAVPLPIGGLALAIRHLPLHEQLARITEYGRLPARAWKYQLQRIGWCLALEPERVTAAQLTELEQVWAQVHCFLSAEMASIDLMKWEEWGSILADIIWAAGMAVSCLPAELVQRVKCVAGRMDVFLLKGDISMEERRGPCW